MDTRCYFSPPVHFQQAYADVRDRELPVTTTVARSVVSLPIYPDLPDADVDTVTEAIRSIHEHARDIRARAR